MAAKLNKCDKELLKEVFVITYEMQLGLEVVVASYADSDIDELDKEYVDSDIKRIEVLKKLNNWIALNIT